MPLQTPRRGSGPRGSGRSARGLPTRDAEAEGYQGDGSDGEDNRELLAEQLRPADGAESRDAHERNPNAGEHEGNRGEGRGEVTPPDRCEGAGGDQAHGHEKRRDETDAHRPRSRARHSATAPASAAKTMAARAAVATASCAKKTRPRLAAPNVPP